MKNLRSKNYNIGFNLFREPRVKKMSPFGKLGKTIFETYSHLYYQLTVITQIA